ncbi:hypothetical protein CI102_11559 [Trichoderma harzianum]|nr:hypothetical protein CI102_11559 [Trichoderma harzianum]
MFLVTLSCCVGVPQSRSLSISYPTQKLNNNDVQYSEEDLNNSDGIEAPAQSHEAKARAENTQQPLAPSGDLRLSFYFMSPGGSLAYGWVAVRDERNVT